MRRIVRFAVLAGVLAFGAAQAAEPGSANRIDLYVTPYYNADGPTVAVDPRFDAGLASSDPALVQATVAQMRQDWARLAPSALFVAAVRLYDIGQRDEAVYWFYEAQLRARVFHEAVRREAGNTIGDPAFEADQAHGAFMDLAGGTINGYGACDVDKLVATLERVRASALPTPDYAAMFPTLRFDDVDAHTKQVSGGLGELAALFRENKDAMAAERKRSGADARYCTP